MSCSTPHSSLLLNQAAGPQAVSGSDPAMSTIRAADASAAAACPGPQGPRGCPGPRGPQGIPGPRPPLSDAVNSASRDTAASSLAVKSVYERTREPLSADLVLHVRQDGNNANDGLGEASALATLGGLVRRLEGIDPRGHTVTVRIGPGRFNGVTCYMPHYDPLKLFFIGSGLEQTRIVSQVNLHGCVSDVTFENAMLYAHYAHYYCRVAGGTKQVAFVMDDASLSCLRVYQGTLDLSEATVRIAGNAQNAMYVFGGGQIIGDVDTRFELVDEPHFSQAFLTAWQPGTRVYLSTRQYIGTATGQRYTLEKGALLHADPDLFPGDQPGDTQPDGMSAVAGTAQAYCSFDGAGTLLRGWNVTSVTRESSGVFTILFTRPVYGHATVVAASNARQAEMHHVAASLESATQCRVEVRNAATGAYSDGSCSVQVM